MVRFRRWLCTAVAAAADADTDVILYMVGGEHLAPAALDEKYFRWFVFDYMGVSVCVTDDEEIRLQQFLFVNSF